MRRCLEEQWRSVYPNQRRECQYSILAVPDQEAEGVMASFIVYFKGVVFDMY